MHFWYAGQGTPIMASYNGKDYYYVTNAQGDVLALLDRANNNEEVVSYSYDAWGKQISCTGTLAGTLGKENPFRYRGYVYDEETGWYYLRSRYYNPEWGRFVNSDVLLGAIGTILDHNLFSYCHNNAVCFYDPDGYKFAEGSGGGAAGGIAVPPATGTNLLQDLVDLVAGLFSGALLSQLVQSVAKAVSNAISNANSAVTVNAQTKVEEFEDSEDSEYWEAWIDNYVVKVGISITYLQAMNRVAAGQDVMARDIMTAYELAAAFGNDIIGWEEGKPPKGHENTYQVPHFHIDRENPAHIFFLGP